MNKSPTNWLKNMQDFLQGRINLVKALRDSDLPFHYADLALIICAVLSACASRRWPGEKKGIDRRRFIELLIKHSPDDFHTSWVSVPSLLNDGFIDETQTPYGKPGNGARIYCDDEIDLSLEYAINTYPQVPLNNLKQHCYAYLIYERLRCGYSHEYWHHESITHVPASSRGSCVSYIGRTSLSDNTTRRMISFYPDYLLRLAEYHVSILPSSCSAHPSWWIDK
jgi:hypothetical protein